MQGSGRCLTETRRIQQRSIVVGSFTNSVLDPDAPMLGPVEDGGTIIANTAPGCWGPMITPSLRGGHEVTQPVLIAGAEVGGNPHLCRKIKVTRGQRDQRRIQMQIGGMDKTERHLSSTSPWKNQNSSMLAGGRP
jgi:hypothetical protein